MVEALLPAGGARIEFRKSVISGCSPRSVPRGFEERSVGLIKAALMPQCNAELIMRFAVIGVGVAAGESGDGSTQMRFGLSQLAALKMPRPERRIGAGVPGVAADGFEPVRLGATCRMPVLLKVQARQVQFIGTGDFFRRRRLSRGFGSKRGDDFSGRVPNEDATITFQSNRK